MKQIDLLREAIQRLPNGENFGIELSPEMYAVLREEDADFSCKDGRETLLGFPVKVGNRPSTVDFGFTVHAIPPGWDFYS